MLDVSLSWSSRARLMSSISAMAAFGDVVELAPRGVEPFPRDGDALRAAVVLGLGQLTSGGGDPAARGPG